MLTEEQLSTGYSLIYSQADERYGLYGMAGRRNPPFVDFIKKHTPRGARVLDAGCGRGTLLRWLIGLGYRPEGTEIADWLLEAGGDLYGLPVRKQFYEHLSETPSEEYDVVISNDVLEHLQTEDDVVEAVRQLARISKRYLLVSTGGFRAGRNPIPTLFTAVKNLHLVVKPHQWWLELLRKHVTVINDFDAAGSYFIFGRKDLPSEDAGSE